MQQNAPANSFAPVDFPSRIHCGKQLGRQSVRLTTDDAKAIETEIPYLRRYARALTGNAEAADDLVQDSLERAIARFDQFRAGTNLRAWLFTIVHNMRCDQHRRLVRRPMEIPIDDAPQQASTRATQADALHLADFRRAFGRLSEPHREVLALVGLEGLNYQRAASILGVEVGTVKSRVFRARECLRREQLLLDQPAPRAMWRAAA
jgi:RNA polymerase sigma-70 factor (ECF subfamily)